ncbi:hypothetical protein CXB51_017214 [Gossypium anomalum]|uniref:Uncharacterized protein n=1 Tax=Gossypium anomalum TaxID=47600 RepID=A0A8J5YGW7_9ROSI|nr:hypothetical protein CXB51_017214 [Gossypium anomalum]
MVETRDTHFPSSMRRMYYHSGGCALIARVTSGWVRSDWDCSHRLESGMQRTFGAGSGDNFWRSDRNGLVRRNFGKLDEDSTEVEREQHARAYILMIIEGILTPDKSRNLVHLRWLLKLINFRETRELNLGFAALSWVRYRLLFLRPEENYPYTFPLVESWAELHEIIEGVMRYTTSFEWTPFKDWTIRECIPSEFLVNPNIWHVKVPLVVYTPMEMHESNRVLQQFRFRQSTWTLIINFLSTCRGGRMRIVLDSIPDANPVASYFDTTCRPQNWPKLEGPKCKMKHLIGLIDY